MKSAHKVSIGSCDPGTVIGGFAFSLIQVAQQFLETKSDWLLMMDSDEQLTVEAFDKLIEAAHDTERPIVAGLVFASFETGYPYPQPVPTIFQDAPEGFLPLNKYDKDSVFQVDAAGTGCLLIHRSVLEAIRADADPHQGQDWCWFWDGPINGEWIGEDLQFCRRVRSLGFPIYAHTGAILSHSKSYWLDDRQHDIWNA